MIRAACVCGHPVSAISHEAVMRGWVNHAAICTAQTRRIVFGKVNPPMPRLDAIALARIYREETR